jgi:hypothetical protein
MRSFSWNKPHIKWDDSIFKNLQSTDYYRMSQNFLFYYDKGIEPLFDLLKSDDKYVDYIIGKDVYYSDGDKGQFKYFQRRNPYNIFLTVATDFDNFGNGYSPRKDFASMFNSLCLNQILGEDTRVIALTSWANFMGSMKMESPSFFRTDGVLSKRGYWIKHGFPPMAVQNTAKNLLRELKPAG